MSTIVLQRLRYNGMRKSWTRTFKAVRRRQKGFTIPFSRDKWMIQKTKKAIWSEAEETEKYIFTYYRFLLTTVTVVQRTTLHTYVATSLYEPRVLHHRARCLLPVHYRINRRLIGCSGVVMRSLLYALNIYRMAFRGMVLRFTGQRLWQICEIASFNRTSDMDGDQ